MPPAKEQAKKIRIALKKAFPKQKFSVRSRAGSVTIRYADGVPSDDVEKVARKFEKLTHDYATGEVLSGYPYVFVDREVSDKYRKMIEEELIRKFAEGTFGSDPRRDYHFRTLVYRRLRQCTIRAGKLICKKDWWD